MREVESVGSKTVEILNEVVRIVLMEKMTFESMLEGDVKS